MELGGNKRIEISLLVRQWYNMYKKYSVIGQVIDKGKRIGFIVRDNSTGIIKGLKLKDVIQLINNKNVQINIKHTKRGFELTDGKRIKGLRVYRLGECSNLTRKVSSYTGKVLEEYVNNMLKGIKEERDFVNGVVHYTSNTYNRVLAISGLRGTGKTIGMLQAIRDIGKYDEIVYMHINDGAIIRCQEIWDIIEERFSGIGYIFIDEITRATGLYNTSAFLSDNLCGEGKRVIISGTDSLAIMKAEESSLYHRVIIKNVTFIKYTEALKTVGQSFREYISMGGLYRAEAIKSISGLRRYIDTAVVDNIMNTLTKNGEITSLLGLTGIEKEKLRVIVFKILYVVIYTSTQKDKALNIQRLIDIFEYRENELDDILDMVTKRLSLDIKIIPTKAEILSVLESMEQIGLLVKALNIEYRYKSTSNEDEYKYYITNPSLTNQVLYSVVEVMKAKGYKAHVMASVKGFRGYILESVVMSHLADICNKFKYDLYYYRDSKSKEIDVVIQKEDKDIFTDDVSKYAIYEIKLTDNPDIAVLKSRWINDGEVLQNISGWAGEIKSKGILYMGESRKFEIRLPQSHWL